MGVVNDVRFWKSWRTGAARELVWNGNVYRLPVSEKSASHWLAVIAACGWRLGGLLALQFASEYLDLSNLSLSSRSFNGYFPAVFVFVTGFIVINLLFNFLFVSVVISAGSLPTYLSSQSGVQLSIHLTTHQASGEYYLDLVQRKG